MQFNRSTDVGWGLHPDVSLQVAGETEPRVDVDHCLRRFRTLKGPNHFSLLAHACVRNAGEQRSWPEGRRAGCPESRKVTQRNGLKGSRHGRDTSPNVSIDTESWSPQVIRPGYTARRRGAEGLKQASTFGGLALSPQRLGASRYRDRVEAGEPMLIAMPQAFRLVTCAAPRALQAVSLGYFSLGQQRKVTRAPTAIESAAGNLPPQRAANFLRRITFSNYKDAGIRQGANPDNAALIGTAMLGFAPQPTEAGVCVA
jgi:hypothetical protein